MVVKSRILRRADHVARMEETRNAYEILVGKSGKPKAENNIKLGRSEI